MGRTFRHLSYNFEWKSQRYQENKTTWSSPLKVLQKRSHFPNRRTSSCRGNPWLGGAGALPVGGLRRLSSSAGAGTGPRQEMGWQLAWEGAQSHGKDCGGQAHEPGPWAWGAPQWLGGLGLFLLSSSGEPYVRTLLGKQEVQLAKFSTGSSTGLVPAHPAQP